MRILQLLLKKFIIDVKQLLSHEARFLDGFMHLLFKRINTGEKWTIEEKEQLKLNMVHLSSYIPALIIFALPGGMMLLPILAKLIDSRKENRRKKTGKA